MADLTLNEEWEDGIYRIELTDQVIGGESGISNIQAKQLGNRTNWLKENLENEIAIREGETGRIDEAYDRLDATDVKLLATRGSGTLIKHGVVACKRTDGVPSFIDYTDGSLPGTPNVIEILTDTPLVVTFAGGYGVNGPVFYYGRLTDNATINLTTDDTVLVVAEYDEVNHEVSISTTTVTTNVASYREPTSPMANQYWYDLANETMFKRIGGAWVKVFHVILGMVNPASTGLVTYYPTIGIGIKDLYGRGHVPAGTVHAFAGEEIPAGYLLCDGSTALKAVYTELYAAIGGTYGEGMSTFTLPDLRGEFIRGLDLGRGVDAGRTLGSAQADELKAHTHSYRGATIVPSGSDPIGTGSTFTTGATGSTGGAETRPRNVAMLYIIKF